MANNFRNADAYFDADPVVPGRMSIRQGGFLRSGLEEFDAGFFGMPPREAAALDPQQRVLLEVTWEAFEDAGIPPGSTAGRGVGAYVGGFTFDAAGLAMADQNRHLLGVATLREQRRQQRSAFLRASSATTSRSTSTH
ncbi:beta-ketoacyl synthase N-terminal-like domain-containing protein [Streptomyces sp. ET3-23]|uniref:beta-ketoacyl synthase N-terminal-like domain-containing protein n=1 Tax=Streptomyces sp. ET3-23 TaxID=2885643 RepID=UPI0027E0A6E4|nr:beta-ketoacyl synthase N-terminal-like domain-containing protein [Streptomyces sp. ET3-23]